MYSSAACMLYAIYSFPPMQYPIHSSGACSTLYTICYVHTMHYAIYHPLQCSTYHIHLVDDVRIMIHMLRWVVRNIFICCNARNTIYSLDSACSKQCNRVVREVCDIISMWHVVFTNNNYIHWLGNHITHCLIQLHTIHNQMLIGWWQRSAQYIHLVLQYTQYHILQCDTQYTISYNAVRNIFINLVRMVRQ
jgi:hypothetical protein